VVAGSLPVLLSWPSHRGRLESLLSLALASVGIAAGDLGASAQEPPSSGHDAVEGYFHAVTDYFGVARSEIDILRDWKLPPEEIPVVLFVASQAGVSTDALVGLRRSGDDWGQIAHRYGLGANAFHVAIPDDAPTGRLDGFYKLIRSTPMSDWDELELEADTVIALVNLRLLAQVSGLTPCEIWSQAGESTGFVELWESLVRRVAGSYDGSPAVLR